MIWVVDNIKTRLVLDEAGLLLDVPIQIELEYELEGITRSTITFFNPVSNKGELPD